MKIVVATTFPIVPARGGGQKRVFYLYSELARAAGCEVEVVALTSAGNVPDRREVAPRMVQTVVPKTLPHEHHEKTYERAAGTIVTDVATALLHEMTPGYAQALKEAAANSAVVVASHPYVLPAIRSVTDGPVWYEAQDVEFDLKQGPLAEGDVAAELLETVREVEGAACRESEAILVCAEPDARRLEKLYGVDRSCIVVVPNGVDTNDVRYVPPGEREKLKRRVGSDRTFTALFTGSWHPPNLEALDEILALAPRLPDVRFLVVGRVGVPVKPYDAPSNVDLAGEVPEGFKDDALAVSDVALNPMRSGTGTNLKMLEYLAGGVPAISSSVGARGLGLEDGVHLMLAEGPGQLEQRIREATAESEASRGARVAAGRELVEKRFSWQAIADQALRSLHEHGRLQETA